MMLDPHGVLAALVAIGVLIGFAVTWLRWLRPKLRRASRDVGAVRDTLIGRDAICDSITGVEISPALPGVGVRLASAEDKLDSNRHELRTLSEAVQQIAKSHERLDNHEDRIIRLEGAAVERVVARAESARAWAAMEAASLSEPPRDGRGVE